MDIFKQMKQGINLGEINGSGQGLVNTNSKDFKGLREAIKEHAKQQTPATNLKMDKELFRW